MPGGKRPSPTPATKPYPWTPTVLPIQMFRIGQLELLGAPAEFTVTRRGADPPRGAGGQRSGRYPPCDLQWLRECLYRLHVTTREEYAAQEYEGGSTLYGPGPRPPTSSCSSTWRWRCANACQWKPRR